ncbi:FAD/NAD(P)-binding domain-containing protein [Ceratobasidium sp. AG-I]|nr:FAD/NAD(P)-binding domain-containing protein [Ceratobasidium sp. AG-I]
MAIFKPHDHPRRFAVIGAGGAAGFEQRGDLGGIWLPDACPSTGNKWPSSPLYNSLKTNIPHPIMLYPSHPVPPSTPLFTSARFVNDYLQSYADRFGLREYIRFNTPVISSTWDPLISQWKAIHQSTIENNYITEHVSFFDHLLVASGHHQHPFVPHVNGLEAWAPSGSRSYTHSSWYRSPEPYCSLNVLVVGGGRSGVDISKEISKVANRTVHSVRSLADQDLERIAQRGAISHISSEGFVSFVGGRREYVDRVIFATGRIPPTSLAFISIPLGLSLFELAEVQSILALRLMSEWYDFVDPLFERVNDTRRTPMWKRELQSQRLAILSGSQKLEGLGLSESWAERVGEGGMQEWVDLIWRVVAYAKLRQHGNTTSNAGIL